MSTTPQGLQPPRPQTARFLFRGTAVAAAGFLTSLKGKPITLDPNAPTVHGEANLPTIGGVSRSVVENPTLAFPEFIEYGRCETSGVGIVKGDATVTTVSASVKTVRVTTSPSPEDRVPDIRLISLQADRLSLTIRSVHPKEGDAYFEVVGTPTTDALSLVISRRKKPVEVVQIRLEYYDRVIANGTVADLDGEFRKNREFFDHNAARFKGRVDLKFGESDFPRTRQGYIHCSIVKRIFRGERLINGNVLEEPGFGAVFFGEMVANDYNRRISLVRAQMGSDPKGEMVFAGADPNGIWS